jgi:hypothetical protein
MVGLIGEKPAPAAMSQHVQLRQLAKVGCVVIAHRDRKNKSYHRKNKSCGHGRVVARWGWPYRICGEADFLVYDHVQAAIPLDLRVFRTSRVVLDLRNKSIDIHVQERRANS